MQDDFDDIRFTIKITIDGGEIPIPYWLEEYNLSDYTIAWVRVPFIPALDKTKIYLYYDNPNAVSESNGPAVFEFFDDFNDQDISDWTIICGSWKADNQFLEQMLTANHRKILSSYTFTGALITEAKMNYISSYAYSGNSIFFSDNSSGSTGYRFGYHGLNGDGTAIDKIYCWLDSDPTIYTGNYPYVWLKGKVTYDGSGNFSFLLRAPDSVQVFLNAYDVTYSYPFTLGNYSGSHTAIDDLRVRKYTYPEPTCSIGLEHRKRARSKFSTPNPTLSAISTTLSLPVKFLLELPKDSKVTADVYDCAGRKVKSLMRNHNLMSGQHTIILGSGNQNLPPGVFFLRLTINEQNGKIYFLNEKLLFLR